MQEIFGGRLNGVGSTIPKPPRRFLKHPGLDNSAPASATPEHAREKPALSRSAP
jgi:hypothetical protein